MTNVEMLDRILWLHMTASLARQSVDVGHMPPPDQLALSCDAVTMTLDLLVAQMVEGDKIPRWELVERCTVIHKEYSAHLQASREEKTHHEQPSRQTSTSV